MGYSVDDFLAECMLHGWRGGKASWLEDRDSRKPAGNEPFDPLAYVNQGRTRLEDAHVIDI
ncbi:hypothetical protein ACXHWJ_08435 [Alcaligenes nematophilus]